MSNVIIQNIFINIGMIVNKTEKKHVTRKDGSETYKMEMVLQDDQMEHVDMVLWNEKVK